MFIAKTKFILFDPVYKDHIYNAQFVDTEYPTGAFSPDRIGCFLLMAIPKIEKIPFLTLIDAD